MNKIKSKKRLPVIATTALAVGLGIAGLGIAGMVHADTSSDGTGGSEGQPTFAACQAAFDKFAAEETVYIDSMIDPSIFVLEAVDSALYNDASCAAELGSDYHVSIGSNENWEDNKYYLMIHENHEEDDESDSFMVYGPTTDEEIAAAVRDFNVVSNLPTFTACQEAFNKAMYDERGYIFYSINVDDDLKSAQQQMVDEIQRTVLTDDCLAELGSDYELKVLKSSEYGVNVLGDAYAFDVINSAGERVFNSGQPHSVGNKVTAYGRLTDEKTYDTNYQYIMGMFNFNDVMKLGIEDVSKDGKIRYKFTFTGGSNGGYGPGIHISDYSRRFTGERLGEEMASSKGRYVLRHDDKNVADVPIEVISPQFNPLPQNSEPMRIAVFDIIVPGTYTLIDTKADPKPADTEKPTDTIKPADTAKPAESGKNEEKPLAATMIEGAEGVSAAVYANGKTEIPAGAKLTVKTKKATEVTEAVRKNDSLIGAYDFALTSSDGKVSYKDFGTNGLTVAVGIDAKYKDVKNLYARYINDEGKTPEADIPVNVVCQANDCEARFVVKHFSIYALLATDSPLTAQVKEEEKPVLATATDKKKPVAETPDTGVMTENEESSMENSIVGLAAVVAGLAAIVYAAHRIVSKR